MLSKNRIKISVLRYAFKLNMWLGLVFQTAVHSFRNVFDFIVLELCS